MNIYSLLPFKNSANSKISSHVTRWPLIKKISIYVPSQESHRILLMSMLVSLLSICWFFSHNQLLSYGDAESHVNISKRVIHSLTPGMAQLGGIWLPLPHILMIPFVSVNYLWRTGLAGSIVSGSAFVITALYIYRLAIVITKHKPSAYIALGLFLTNPNLLYMQATPMTELPLLMFFTLSTYYTVTYLYNKQKLQSLILAAFLALAATLTRYDAWFMVIGQSAVIGIKQLVKNWRKVDSQILLFVTVAFFGIVLWLSWDWIILGDPFYFTNSEYSAKSQQQDWRGRGQLPAYHDLYQSLLYYTLTAAANIGYVLSPIALIGIGIMLINRKINPILTVIVLLTPFVFNVYTLFAGQSVIFLPLITPEWFDWQLFNVRYGLMMVPAAYVGVSVLYVKIKPIFQKIILFCIVIQLSLFITGKQSIVSWEDGVQGLSSAKESNAAEWFRANYDGGLILMDDFARSISVTRSGIPMQSFISEANKPYWPDSLIAPEKHATWIIMQKNDKLWKAIYDSPDIQGRLYKYFQKVYTSDEVLIFRKNPQIAKN